MKDKQNSIEIKNKRAEFEYHLDIKFQAGIVLTGPEIKSIRLGHANISDAYALINENRIVIRNMHISPFKNAGYISQEPLRDRFLLLNKSEIKKIENKLKDKGYTLIPVRLYFSESGYAKIEIALARGKKLYDKREDLRTKDLKREMDRLT